MTATLAAGLGSVALPAQAGTVIPSIPRTNPVDWTPRVIDGAGASDAGVYELRQVGGTMYAGGRIRTVTGPSGSPTYSRMNIFAFDATTGAVLNIPNLSANGDVYAIEPTPDGRYLYIGGDFGSFGGRSANNVVKFDLTTNTVVPGFAFPVATGRVSDLQLVGNRLFVAGNWNGGIVAVDPNTGARTSYLNNVQVSGQTSDSQTTWTTRVYRFAVNPQQTRMVIIGSFTSVGGQARRQVAMINLGSSSATVSPWYSTTWNRNCIRGMQWYTRDVDWSPDGSFFVVGNTGGAITNTFCDTATRWAPVDAPNQRPAWIQMTGGDTIHSVAVTDKAVFLGGHFRWLDNPEGRNTMGPGAARAQGLGAIDVNTGRAIRTWNPTKGLEGGRGAYDLYPTSAGLWVGHFEQRLGGELHPGLGLLPY